MLRKRPTYDRMVTVFSPDGRLFQVEYAMETVKRGKLSLGVVTKEGVLLAAEEYLNRFQDKRFSRKLFIVDDNVGVAVAGYVPDGRVLMDYAREYCQRHRQIYDEPAKVETVARRISDVMRDFTQMARVRPFGVSMIFGGVDANNEPKMFVTDPSGACVKYFANVIGSRSEPALNFLSENYDRAISLEEAKTLTAAAIQRSTTTPEEVKVRFLEIPKEAISAELTSIDESSEYLKRAKEIYGG